MTTNETFFFRDKIPFDHLRDTIIPALLQARANRRSLAHLVRGVLDRAGAVFDRDVPEGNRSALAGWRVEILATDLSQGVLEKSRAGIFSQFEVQRGLPIQMLVKHFTQAGELWQLNADIRAMVQHRQLNLLQDFSHLGTFDVIFCRNVLIYFDRTPRPRSSVGLRKAIEPDGVSVAGRGRIRGRDIRRFQALSGTARALPPERRPHSAHRLASDNASDVKAGCRRGALIDTDRCELTRSRAARTAKYCR